MKKLAANDGICRLLMTVPGVGPVVALAFRAGVDEPARFARSRAFPARFGLTPARCQSGELDRGPRHLRVRRYRRPMGFGRGGGRHPAAQGPALAPEGLGRGDRQAPEPARAMVAVARRLGTIPHRRLVDHAEYRWEGPTACSGTRHPRSPRGERSHVGSGGQAIPNGA